MGAGCTITLASPRPNLEGGQNKKMRTGAWNQGAATAQITRRDRAGNVKVPAASRRAIHVAVSQLRAPHAKTNAIIT